MVLREEPPLLAGVALGPGVVFQFVPRPAARAWLCFGLFLPLDWCFWRLVLGVRRRLARRSPCAGATTGAARTLLFLTCLLLSAGKIRSELMLCPLSADALRANGPGSGPDRLRTGPEVEEALKLYDTAAGRFFQRPIHRCRRFSWCRSHPKPVKNTPSRSARTHAAPLTGSSSTNPHEATKAAHMPSLKLPSRTRTLSPNIPEAAREQESDHNQLPLLRTTVDGLLTTSQENSSDGIAMTTTSPRRGTARPRRRGRRPAPARKGPHRDAVVPGRTGRSNLCAVPRRALWDTTETTKALRPVAARGRRQCWMSVRVSRGDGR